MTVTVERPKDIEALYTRTKNDAAQHNITWTGDMQKGHGSGFGFKGKYVVGADTITVTVLKKPLFATKSRVENAIRGYITQAG